MIKMNKPRKNIPASRLMRRRGNIAHRSLKLKYGMWIVKNLTRKMGRSDYLSARSISLWMTEWGENRNEGEGRTYFGQLRTPSSVSLDSGGFLSILIPSFSMVVIPSDDALTDRYPTALQRLLPPQDLGL